MKNRQTIYWLSLLVLFSICVYTAMVENEPVDFIPIAVMVIVLFAANLFFKRRKK